MTDEPPSTNGSANAPAEDCNIDILVSGGQWSQERACAVVRRAALAALAQNHLVEDGVSFKNCDLSIELADDDRICELNAKFRHKSQPTNVLSFPSFDAEDLKAELSASQVPNSPPICIGDIILAEGIIMREAKDQAKRFEDHLSHLVVHGVLHCLGYDHEGDDDARQMEDLERHILASLGVKDPYRSENGRLGHEATSS